MARPDRIRLVVLFGGASPEHEVSCTTAAHVLRALDHSRYQVVPVAITPAGGWVVADEAVAALARGAASLPDRLASSGTPTQALEVVAPVPTPGIPAMPTVVLPLLHGPHGEDGTVQGLLELAGVPYVGSGVLGSALAMDKAKAKEVLAANGLPQARWRALRDRDVDDESLADAGGALGFPLFVKPANMGSSIGVSKVAEPSQLAPAVALAAGYDEWIVLEEHVAGRELECGVLGNAEPRASAVGEIRPGAEFYDYRDKYDAGAAELLVPAPVPHAVADEVRSLALRAYRALRCDGMARVDFFWDQARARLLVNELNTIPGFTPLSMYPKLWAASGIPYAALIDELVALAVDRHRHRSGLRTTR